MAVSGVELYANSLFQWQNNSLKQTSTSSSSSSSASSLSSLFTNSSTTSQISSMIELVKYSMDAMGLSSNSRVTFSQITKYREQLQSEFTAGVKNGIANSGISDLAGLTFAIDKNGTISVSGSNSSDVTKAQNWLNANTSYGQEIASALEEAGIELEDSIQFLLSSSGKLTVIDNEYDSIKKAQEEISEDADWAQDLKNGLKEFGVDTDIDFVFSGDNLVVKGDFENKEEINAWLDENQEIASAISKILTDNNLQPVSATLTLSANGGLDLDVKSEALDIQSALDTVTETGVKIYNGLNSVGIDKNINFSIQVNDDGTVTIISDHADRDKLQAFFDDNPELVKKYRQIETLAGVDDARKAMQISSTEMRKRIQVESLYSWWVTSDDSNSYFGNYSDGILSLYSGLNLNV